MSRIEIPAKNVSLWQTFRTAAWLEWQVQGNWTRPWLFVLYLMARPLTGALVLVCMYWVVSGFQRHGGILGFLIVGSAAWSFVDQIMVRLSNAILDDREQFAMLKYVYIAPQSFMVFLVGRCVPRMLAACLSFVITLGFGILILGAPIDLLRVNYLLLLLALLLGFIVIVSLGIAVAGLTLLMKRDAWQMPEAASGALYLLSGAIFPIAILPEWVEKVALLVPLTYWLELVRRALLGDAVGATFPIVNTGEVVGWLLVTTVVVMAVSVGVFRVSDYVARERGQIDRATGN